MRQRYVRVLVRRRSPHPAASSSAYADLSRPASSHGPDVSPGPRLLFGTCPEDSAAPTVAEPKPWQRRRERTRTPTSAMADCARKHPKSFMVGRNAVSSWIKCCKCNRGQSWRTMEMDFMKYQSLRDLQGGRLRAMHLALRTQESSSCVVCAAGLAGPRRGIPVSWCETCAARLCLNPNCISAHNREYHLLPARCGIDICVRGEDRSCY